MSLYLPAESLAGAMHLLVWFVTVVVTLVGCLTVARA